MDSARSSGRQLLEPEVSTGFPARYEKVLEEGLKIYSGEGDKDLPKSGRKKQRQEPAGQVDKIQRGDVSLYEGFYNSI